MAELVVAMDVPDGEKAQVLAQELQGVVSWIKVGLELFASAGPDLVARLREKGFHIFLDLKFYDIPNTVAKAVLAAARHDVRLLTLHCQGGRRMCEAAVEAARSIPEKQRPLLFGVTVLTSFANGEMPGIARDCRVFGMELAVGASSWGLDGVVCSGHEVRHIKTQNSNLLCLCPGIRLEPGVADDQRRTMSPEEAVALGADFLVAGRPILQARDPRGAAIAVLERMRRAGA